MRSLSVGAFYAEVTVSRSCCFAVGVYFALLSASGRDDAFRPTLRVPSLFSVGGDWRMASLAHGCLGNTFPHQNHMSHSGLWQ